jgi:hypothetical protein
MPSYASNFMDITKIALMAWVGVFVINRGLRAAGLAAYTTKGS